MFKNTVDAGSGHFSACAPGNTGRRKKRVLTKLSICSGGEFGKQKKYPGKSEPRSLSHARPKPGLFLIVTLIVFFCFPPFERETGPCWMWCVINFFSSGQCIFAFK